MHSHPVIVALRCGALLLALLAAAPGSAMAEETKGEQGTGSPAHGFSPIHALKYPAGFSHFDYVNADAPKGGTIRIARQGTFNSLNLLKYPGHTPLGRHDVPYNLANYLYDSLLAASADEAAGYYGLLARSVEVDPAYRWVRFTLRDDAEWHDGRPISVDDVIFTFETMKSQGLPFFRQSLRGLSIAASGENEVTFTAKRPGNREMVNIVGLLPIHPKHYWEKNDVSKTTMTPPLAGGPYRIVKAVPGRSLRLERAANYWGADHPVNVGRYNFDAITLEFYRDNTTALEAFKSGDADLRQETDAVSWANAYKGEAGKKIRKIAVSPEAPGRLVSLVFNLRRELFQDRKVRKALALAYDFERTNFTLFHGLYHRVESRYGATELAARGAAEEGERALLSPFAKDLPAGLFDAPGPSWRKAGKVSRAKLEEAARLLDEAGLALKNGKRIDPASGEALTLSVAYTNPRHQRVLTHYAATLEKLGITLSYPALEPVSASKKVLDHDYDLTFLQWQPKLAAGSSEFLLWSSAMAKVERSYALSGALDPALDAAIDAMNKARDWRSLVSGARAFDRVLRWRVYDVPLWGSGEEWIAYWDKFGRPQIGPSYVPTFIDLWWAKPVGARQSNALGAEESGRL